MQVSDLMKPNGRVFLKSEWGQISNAWPCVSFTKRFVGDKLRREFVVGRDVLIYVGTTNPDTTLLEEHRSRLISVVTIEPNQVLETRKIVPPNVWESSRVRWPNRWPYSMAVIRAANMLGPPFPSAHDIVPHTYRSLGAFANRGSVAEVVYDERQAVMALQIEPVTLTLSGDVLEYIELKKSFSSDVEKLVQRELFRMAELIQKRVRQGGESNVKINASRTAPNLSDLNALLLRKWREQKGLCGLCNGTILLGSSNKMMQPSADRIDSANGAYDDENVWITHLACNFAKNKYGLEECEEWLSVIRRTI